MTKFFKNLTNLQILQEVETKMTKNQVRVLIGDDSAEAGMEWARSLMAKGMYAITRAKNGRVLLDTIKSDRFDVVVIEAKMPELDAVCLINEMNAALENPPIVVVIANYDSPTAEREVMEAGAKYYMVKPFEASVLGTKIERLLDGSQASQLDLKQVSYSIHDTIPDNIEYVVTDIIHQIGIPAHIKGYHYLRTAILLSVEDTQMINCVTKLLYPTVAKQYQTTSSRVERAIRHAIEIAWDRGNVDTLNSFFGYTIHTAKGKPTNSEFIALISDKLKLKFKMSSNASLI
jgi:two-component system response regulator (stage 0 sporulation protein A)